MKKIEETFEFYKEHTNNLIGYHQIKTHFIFDIQISENFRRKSRLV